MGMGMNRWEREAVGLRKTFSLISIHEAVCPLLSLSCFFGDVYIVSTFIFNPLKGRDVKCHTLPSRSNLNC